MNNEQNNSIFNIPNQTTTPPENNIGTPTIPGANLNTFNPAPIASQTTTQSLVETTIPVQQVPNIVGNNPGINTTLDMNNNTITVNPNSVMPNVVTPITTTDSVASQNNNVNQGLNLLASSPFDIGINLSNNTENTTTNVPVTPLNNNFTTTLNEQVQPLYNNIGTPSNNLNNASQGLNQNTNMNSGVLNNNMENSTISSNQNNNNVSTNDNIVTVGKYLGYIVLFSIPIIGFIMLLIKAFGEKKDKNISNLAKAQLLFSLIVTAITVILMVISAATVVNIINNIRENQNLYNEEYNPNYDYDNDYGYNYDYS